MIVFGKESVSVEFKFLYGEHILSAVEHRNITTEEAGIEYAYNSQVDAILFTLDGKDMVAIENPSDGYRSMLEGVFLTDIEPRYKIPDAKVFIAGMDGLNADGITMYDYKTGKPVLKIGTSHTDSYYPCCIMDYTPENLSFNN